MPHLLVLSALLLLGFCASRTCQADGSEYETIALTPTGRQDPRTFNRETAHAPARIELKGGLLHSYGYYVDAKLGDEPIKLQIDFSQGALTVPDVDCSSCRIGDKRYDPHRSPSGAAIPCHDTRCGPTPCDRTTCPSCSANGACCSRRLPDTCAYDVTFVDQSNANGTLFDDSLELGGHITVPSMLFAAMYEESPRFELPYVDGVLGLANAEKTCSPACVPAAIDIITASAGLPSAFTMCVNRYGGTLVLGSPDYQALASEPFQHIDLLESDTSGYYHVQAAGYGMVGESRVELPEVVSAIWSSATTSMVVGKTTFMTILEKVMDYSCDIPGLCSPNSWFRPLNCHPVSDEDLQKLPAITFVLSENVQVVLKPEDYLLPYQVEQGKQQRCLAFIVSERLAARGTGIMLGSVVMSRYAVSFDREKKRVGLATAIRSECGPATGSNLGLEVFGDELSLPKNMTVLTPFSPSANISGPTSTADFEEAERCRALATCDECAAAANCSFRYTDGQCVLHINALLGAYPYCSGNMCVCFAVSKVGWYVGLLIGALSALVAFSVCVCMYKLRQQRIRYQEVVPFADNEVETF